MEALTGLATWAASYVQAHLYQTAVSGVSLALTPLLGTGWLVAIPLKAVGFGAAGVGVGTYIAVEAYYEKTC